MKRSVNVNLYNAWIVLYTCTFICVYIYIGFCYVEEVSELLSLRIERESVG